MSLCLKISLPAIVIMMLMAGCRRSNETVAPPPSAASLAPTATPVTVTSAPVCPPARGVGTVSPAVSIYSITFLVNDGEQVVYANGTLQTAPGDKVQIRDVTICAGEFPGNGGEVCVDFAPTDRSGQGIMSKHYGTHMVSVTPGFVTISNLDFTWAIAEDWSGFLCRVNHWPTEKTQDVGCAGGSCERDDWIIIAFH